MIGEAPEPEPSRKQVGRPFVMSLALVAAGVCLALGISLPTIKLTRFAVFTSEHSLISAVSSLLQSGQSFLGLVVLVLAIVLPVLKLAYLVLLSTLPSRDLQRLRRQLGALEWIGRWSMHDVLVLSLTIFFLKSHGTYDPQALNGIYFFMAAVVIMVLVHAAMRHQHALVTDDSAPVSGAMAEAGAWPMRPVVLSFLIILATVFFALGVMLPAIRFTTVYVWSKEHSIGTIIWALYRDGELLLCFVIFLFSIAFPFMKLMYLLTLISSQDVSNAGLERSLTVMEWLGRYSMTDVMVLALLIFYVNSSGVTEATILPGVYFFAASTLMTMLAYGWANSGPRQARA